MSDYGSQGLVEISPCIHLFILAFATCRYYSMYNIAYEGCGKGYKQKGINPPA